MEEIVWIDGGIGRVICALPAIDALAENREVVVVTSFPEVFFNKDNIKRVYRPDHNYLWEDVIQKGNLIQPEPYWNSLYYRERIHLIDAFHKELGTIEEENVPGIVLNKFERSWAKKSLSALPKKKNLIFQPFGSSFDGEADPSNRSMNMKDAQSLANSLSDKYNVIYIGQFKLENVYPAPNDLGIRGFFALIQQADYFVGVDSFGQHVAFSFGVPGLVLIGGTDKNNISYPKHFKIFNREGFPKEYNPYRIPYQNHTAMVFNEGAMDFTAEELDEIKKLIGEE